MSKPNQRVIATVMFWFNLLLASLTVISYMMAWFSEIFSFTLPSIASSVVNAGLVIYWRFWYIFALPAFYLGQSTYASRRRLLITALTVFIILLIKFLYGYQLPS